MVRITDVFTGQFILACWAIFLLVWCVSAFFVKKTVDEHENKVAAGILLRMGIGIIVIVIASQRLVFLTASLWTYSTTVGVVADIVAGAGLLLLLWARAILGRNWSAMVVLKKEHELIRTGPYALIRHPIYSGLLLLFLGEAIWYGTVMWFLVLLIVAITVHYKALREEALLQRHFEKDYPTYKKETTMFVPFVW